MKRSLLLLHFIFCILYVVIGQTPYIKKWDKTYGGDEPDLVTALIRTGDGGFITGGFSFSDSSGNKSQDNWGGTTFADFWLVKTDSLGQKQWDRHYGGTDTDTPSEIINNKGGGYMVLGSSNSGVNGDKTQPAWGLSTDYWLVKLDAAGNRIWDKRYGGLDNDYASAIVQLPGGGYVIAGSSFSGIGGDKTQAGWGSSDYWALKIDAAGNIIWDRRFGGTGFDDLEALLLTAEGNLLLGGTSSSEISGDKTEASRGFDDYWIIKIDTLGSKIWDKRYGGNQLDELNKMLQTPDGGYLLAGGSSSLISPDKSQNPFGNLDYWVIKVDSNGVRQWDRIYGGTDKEEQEGNLIRTFDGNYVISGSSYSPISGNKTEANLGFEQAWLMKFDSLGNVIQDKTIFTVDHDEVCRLVESADGCLVLAIQSSAPVGGYKSEPSWGVFEYFDYWMIKICDTTLLPVAVKLISFTGKASGDKNILYWTTAGETNNDFFRILRSRDGNNFQPITRIKGAGNSAQNINYSFVDTNPFTGMNYYRLEQTDFNGQLSFSKTITLNSTSHKINPVLISPNPARNEINISGIDFNAGDEIEIINALGKIIYQKKIDQPGTDIKLQTLNFQAGIYFIKIKQENKIFSQKFIRL